MTNDANTNKSYLGSKPVAATDMRHMSRPTKPAPVTIPLLLALTVGCTAESFHVPKWTWPWSRPSVVTSQYQVPTRMVVVWTPDTLTLPGRPPTRGFGGRIYFYNNQGQAIPVDGQLIVYGFDDSDPEVASTVPHKRFVFTPEQFTKHFSPTELGASYSVWIPWDSNDNRQKTISLLPVFTAVSGHRVVGEQTINVLRGRTEETVIRRAEWRRIFDQRKQVAPNGPSGTWSLQNPTEIPTASFEPKPKRTLRTSTIPLTPALGYAIQENPNSSPLPSEPMPTSPSEQVASPGTNALAPPSAVPQVTPSGPGSRFPYWLDRAPRESAFGPGVRSVPHQFPVPTKPSEPAVLGHAP